MSSIAGASGHTPLRGVGRVLVPVIVATVICVALDVALLAWIGAGPPAGKGDGFFLELALLLAGASVISATAILAPSAARASIPLLFIVMAWHTGFQVPLEPTGEFVLTVFDVLVPLALILGLIGEWYVSGTGVRSWFGQYWKLMAVFWGFCVWGLALAIVNDISADPLLANLKSFIIYPLIMIILPWCIRSWKQLYLAVGLLVALVFERTLEGLYQAYTHQVLKFQTLIHGQIVYRIDGHMAATNQYADYLLTGALIALAIVAASRLRLGQRLSLAAPLALTALALLLTYSRGAWLGTLVALLAMLMMMRPRRAFLTMGVLAGIVIVIEALHPGAGGSILQRTFNDYDHSIATRKLFEATGYTVLLHYPFGAGWGAWFQLVPGGIQAIPGFPWYHDDYLQLATEVGIPGVIPMLAILFSIVVAGWRASVRADNATKAALMAGVTAAFVGILVQTATDQFLWHADIAPHIWIVAGLVLSGAALVGADRRRKQTIADAMKYAENADTPAPPGLPQPAGRATF